MKKQDQKEGGIFRKKGFYIALYSCIGMMLLAAAVISFRNLTLMTDPLKSANQEPIDFSQLEQANANMPRMTVPPAATAKPTVKPTVKPTTNPKPAVTPKPTVQPTATPAQTSKPETKVEASPAPATSATSSPTTSIEAPVTAPDNETAEASAKKPNEMGQVEPMFTAFMGEAVMSWPVLGEIVMEYSPTHGIYDLTLDQYRTNDSICIAAPVGTPVKSAAEGVVISVTKTRREGNTVTIDNGNGWTTTYGQMMDDVLVSQGDVVKSGQVIGGVGNPSIYKVLLGSHVSMRVHKDNETIDPTTLLASNE